MMASPAGTLLQDPEYGEIRIREVKSVNLSNPVDLAWLPNNDMIVVDSDSHRLRIFDTNRFTIRRSYYFKSEIPLRVAVMNDLIFVAFKDSLRCLDYHEIYKGDSEEKMSLQWQTFGLYYPLGLSVHEGRLYAGLKGRLIKFNAAISLDNGINTVTGLTPEKTWTVPKDTTVEYITILIKGPLLASAKTGKALWRCLIYHIDDHSANNNVPHIVELPSWGMHAIAQDMVLITDWERRTVWRISLNSESFELGTKSAIMTGDNGLWRPCAVTVDSRGHLVVLTWRDGRGGLLQIFTVIGTKPIQGKSEVVSNSTGHSVKFQLY